MRIHRFERIESPNENEEAEMEKIDECESDEIAMHLPFHASFAKM